MALFGSRVCDCAEHYCAMHMHMYLNLSGLYCTHTGDVLKTFPHFYRFYLALHTRHRRQTPAARCQSAAGGSESKRSSEQENVNEESFHMI